MSNESQEQLNKDRQDEVDFWESEQGQPEIFDREEILPCPQNVKPAISADEEKYTEPGAGSDLEEK